MTNNVEYAAKLFFQDALDVAVRNGYPIKDVEKPVLYSQWPEPMKDILQTRDVLFPKMLIRLY